MELVYLWVEEYNNIEKQGFNFSSRFECKFYDKYDEDGKLRDDCILEIKPKEHIENFFGDNINMTAIVGKNGSGKSSVLEILLYFIDSNFKNQGFLIFKNDEKYYCIDKFSLLNSFNLQKYKINKLENKNILVSVFFNCITNFFTRIKYSCREYDYNDTLCNGFKPNIKYNLNYEIEFFYQKYSRLIVDLSFVEHNFHFDKFEIVYNDADFVFEDSEKITIYTIILKILKKEFNEYYYQKNRTEISKDSNLVKAYNDFLFPVNITKNTYMDFIKKIKEFFDKNQDSLSNIEEKDVIIKEILKFSIKDIENNFNDFIENDSFKSKSFNLDNLFNFLKDKKILSFFVNKNIFQIELFNAQKPEIRYLQLSSGEKNLLKILVDIIYSIQTLSKPRNYLLLLDEIELSLHPYWQKKLINFILISIHQLKKKKEIVNIHLVFTTHSPFLLSDIPKQNIIFLDTYKEKDREVKNREQKVGNCKVLSHDEVLSKNQTFGANIHTLLSDSFFMEDGLMGEFAKGKITEIKRFYEVFIKYQEKKKIKKAYKWIYLKKRKKFWQIQSIIGEPFLKTVIKNYLDEVENILFDNKAKEMAIERIIREYGIEDIEKGLKSVKS